MVQLDITLFKHNRFLIVYMVQPGCLLCSPFILGFR